MNRRHGFMHTLRQAPSLVMMLLAALLFAGCQTGTPAPLSTTIAPIASMPVTSLPASETPAEAPSAPPITATPAALAARVNGLVVTLAEYEAELQRYAASAGHQPNADEQALVLEDLTNTLLLAAGAQENGFSLSPQDLQERLDHLANQLGGREAVLRWQEANFYSPESFLLALERTALAAWMRDQIAAGVPDTAEQVHARQILLYNQEDAQEVLAQLQAGSDFETLAKRYNALTGGDLGWIARHSLPYPALEEAIFALEPGETTTIIQTIAGFHIVQLIERDPQRPLDAPARQAFQSRQVQEWLSQKREQGQLEILITINR